MEIRTLALAIIQHFGKLLVMECADLRNGERFYRPLGGGINFGETAKDALIREFREEMQTTLKNVEYVTTLENIYLRRGQVAHEIILFFKAELEDKSLFAKDGILCDEAGTPFVAKWVSVEDFSQSKEILYPHGLLQLI